MQKSWHCFFFVEKFQEGKYQKDFSTFIDMLVFLLGYASKFVEHVE